MITPTQFAAAQAVQDATACDGSPQVRLVAGPGSGKSRAIVQRICGLLSQGIAPESINVVSFTRASALDLRLRVKKEAQGMSGAGKVRVTTLHSLALRVLQTTGILQARFPVRPLILDDWEIENIFDEEFGHVFGIGKERREEIRREHEAFWSTGNWGPPNYIPPVPPINDEERTQFIGFHRVRTQVYSCVLPGEIIRLCVENMESGLLNAVEKLGISHLIVDEFQDLNPLDLMFVDHFISQGAIVFVAGDDDQSIYSFRFATPSGIQNFPSTYPMSARHQLTACFRCARDVLAASTALITANPAPNRIAKRNQSLYIDSTPPVAGAVFRWRFPNANREAKAIAESCRALIAAGINPREILILLYKKSLGRDILDELTNLRIDAEHPREEGFRDSDTGRLVLALLRIIGNPNDYISHRALLGLQKGVAVGTCNKICELLIQNSLNLRSIFYDPVPSGVFTTQLTRVIDYVKITCKMIATWNSDNTISQRSGDISRIIEAHYDIRKVSPWQQFFANLPPQMTLGQLLDYLVADTDELQNTVLCDVLKQLGQHDTAEGLLPARVRVMTMHGAKGLSSKVVFIPGLEEEIIPGERNRPFPGLILECARLLYVSITRARAACVLSFADRRFVNGVTVSQKPSRFAADTGGAFSPRESGLQQDEVGRIMTDCENL